MTTNGKIKVITREDFNAFVQNTGYRTTAELQGASMCTNYKRKIWSCKETWRDTKFGHPVVHVSPVDAEAFCEWSKTRLLTPQEYYTLKDDRPVWKTAEESMRTDTVSIIGNVWDIITIDGAYLIAGGSFACGEQSCNGTEKSSDLYFQKLSKHESANHIGFIVLIQ
jgi:hypothetical protein